MNESWILQLRSALWRPNAHGYTIPSLVNGPEIRQSCGAHDVSCLHVCVDDRVFFLHSFCDSCGTEPRWLLVFLISNHTNTGALSNIKTIAFSQKYIQLVVPARVVALQQQKNKKQKKNTCNCVALQTQRIVMHNKNFDCTHIECTKGAIGIISKESKIARVESLEAKQKRLHEQLLHRRVSFRSLILQELRRQQQVFNPKSFSWPSFYKHIEFHEWDVHEILLHNFRIVYVTHDRKFELNSWQISFLTLNYVACSKMPSNPNQESRTQQTMKPPWIRRRQTRLLP